MNFAEGEGGVVGAAAFATAGAAGAVSGVTGVTADAAKGKLLLGARRKAPQPAGSSSPPTFSHNLLTVFSLLVLIHQRRGRRILRSSYSPGRTPACVPN